MSAESAISTSRGSQSLRSSETRWGFGLIAPMMIGFSIFFLIALGASLVLSFTRWDLLNPPEFNGLDNYRRMLSDSTFIIVFYVDRDGLLR